LTSHKKIRYIIFLKDILILALTCIGGPQAHIALFLRKLVYERGYITETELIELQGLCSVLPGPTSTQTITAIGYKVGGRNLAYITLLVWISPACILMASLAYFLSAFESSQVAKITQFIKPMGVAFILFSVSSISLKHIKTKTSLILMMVALGLGLVFKSPYMTPLVILGGGLLASTKYRRQNKIEKTQFNIDFTDLAVWGVFFLILIFIGTVTKSLPIRLFENFYRNGSFAFGGGHVLKPLLYNEFVEFKKYLSADEYLSGVSFSEIVPGPTFSIAAYVGALSMKAEGGFGQFLGAFVASLGIFLPGIFMIFFAIKFWDNLKQYRGIRASLEGINAATIGLTFAAGISLFLPICTDNRSIFTVLLTILLLYIQKIPSYVLILGGLALGFLF
jgi:chromate transporter